MSKIKRTDSYFKSDKRLNKDELKLLAELENDARQPLSQIAKKLHISQQLLSYRLQCLKNRGVLFGFYTMIYFTMFGYTRYRTMVRLSNISKQKYKEIISYLMNHSNVQWIVECGGRWDLIINFMAKNIIQFDGFVAEFKTKFPEQIQNYDVLIGVEILELGRDYFTKRKRESKVLSYFGRKYKPIKYDKTDLKILDLISENARMNSVEISDKIGVTPNTVILRINNMKEKGLIHAFRPLIHLENTPYSTYKAPIKFQNLTKQKEDEMINYLKNNINIVAINKLIGQWDFEFEFEVDSKETMLELTRNFRDKFKDVIKEFEIIPLFHDFRYNFFPRDMLT